MSDAEESENSAASAEESSAESSSEASSESDSEGSSEEEEHEHLQPLDPLPEAEDNDEKPPEPQKQEEVHTEPQQREPETVAKEEPQQAQEEEPKPTQQEEATVKKEEEEDTAAKEEPKAKEQEEEASKPEERRIPEVAPPPVLDGETVETTTKDLGSWMKRMLDSSNRAFVQAFRDFGEMVSAASKKTKDAIEASKAKKEEAEPKPEAEAEAPEEDEKAFNQRVKDFFRMDEGTQEEQKQKFAEFKERMGAFFSRKNQGEEEEEKEEKTEEEQRSFNDRAKDFFHIDEGDAEERKRKLSEFKGKMGTFFKDVESWKPKVKGLSKSDDSDDSEEPEDED